MVHAQVLDLGHVDAGSRGAELAIVLGHARHLAGPAAAANFLSNQNSFHALIPLLVPG
jgi:hypothetical protein